METTPAIDLTPPPGPTEWGYRDVILLVGIAAASLIFAIALAAAGFQAYSLIVGGDPSPDQGPLRLAIALTMQFFWWAMIFMGLFYIVAVRHQRDFWPAVGWKPFHSPVFNFFTLGILLAFGVGAIAQVIPMPEEKLPMEELLTSREAVWLMAFFGILIAPPVEEIVFRGFLFPVLQRLHGVAVAVAGTAAVFAALHGQQYGFHWQILLILFLVGSALGVIRARTGSVIASTITHATYNATLFAALLFVDEEALKQLESGAAAWL